MLWSPAIVTVWATVPSSAAAAWAVGTPSNHTHPEPPRGVTAAEVPQSSMHREVPKAVDVVLQSGFNPLAVRSNPPSRTSGVPVGLGLGATVAVGVGEGATVAVGVGDGAAPACVIV